MDVAGFEKGSASELLLPTSYRKRLDSGNDFRVAGPPKFGEAYGNWAGRTQEEAIWQMPGGALMQFDLRRLGLADYRQMLDHYQVSIAQQILTVMMYSIDWWITHPDKKIESMLNEQMRDIWIQLVRGMSQARWAGYSPMVLQWENNPRTGYIQVNKVKDLYPEECNVHWKKVKGYAPRGQAKPDRYIYDGINQSGWSNYKFSDGTWDNQGNENKNFIPPESTFWYTYQMPNGDYYGRKALRPAFPPVFFSNLLHLFANRYFERFGEPLPIGRAPWDEDVTMPDGTQAKGHRAMERILDNLRSRAAVVLPSDKAFDANGNQTDFDYNIEYLESQMRGADFERYMARLDEEISLAFFLPVLLYRVSEIGSFNLGESHLRLFQTSRNYEAEDVARQIEKFILRRLIDYNFGPGLENAKFEFRPMGKDRDETTRAILQSAIQQQQLKIDAEDMSMLAGVKLEEVVQVVDPETQPINPPKTVKNGKASNTSIAIDNSVSLYQRGEPLPGRNDMWRSLMRDGMSAFSAEKKTNEVFKTAEAFLSSVELGEHTDGRIQGGLRLMMGDLLDVKS